MASRCGVSPFIDSSRAPIALDLLGHQHEDVGLLLQLGHRRHVAIAEVEDVGDLEHVVDDVVEPLGEGVDVLPVERRDERRVQPVEDVAGELVAAALAGDHGVEPAALLVEQLAQSLGALGDVDGRGGEQLEEAIVAREQSEPHENANGSRVNGG